MVACIFSISFVLLIFRGLLPVYSPVCQNKAPSHACTNRHWAKAYPLGTDFPRPGKPLFASTISTSACFSRAAPAGGDGKGICRFRCCSPRSRCRRAAGRSPVQAQDPSPTPPISRLLDLSTRKKGWNTLSRAVSRGCRGLYLQRAAQRCFSLPDRDVHCPAGGVLFDAVFNQIKDQPVDQRITAHDAAILTS